MVRQAAVLFILFLFLTSSKGFRIPDSCLQIQFIPLSELRDKLDSVNTLRMVNCIGGIYEQSDELRAHLGSTFALLHSLAGDATAILAKPASTVAIFTAPIVISYYLSYQANELLKKAQFEHDDLDFIVKVETSRLVALLHTMNTVYQRGNDNSRMGNICKNKDGMKEILSDTIEKLQNARKRSEKLLIVSDFGENLNSDLQKVCIVLGTGSALVWFFGPVPLPAPWYAGLIIANGLAYFKCESNIITHQEAQIILNSSRNYAMEAEKLLRHALISLKFACFHPDTPQYLQLCKLRE